MTNFHYALGVISPNNEGKVFTRKTCLTFPSPVGTLLVMSPPKYVEAKVTGYYHDYPFASDSDFFMILSPIRVNRKERVPLEIGYLDTGLAAFYSLLFVCLDDEFEMKTSGLLDEGFEERGDLGSILWPEGH